jgi:hypothetical protein
MTDLKRPLVGVGVIIHDRAGTIIMGERAGSHGAGKSHHLHHPIQMPSPPQFTMKTPMLCVSDETQELSNSPAATWNTANLSPTQQQEKH